MFKCKVCKVEKDLSFFGNNKNYKNGKNSSCKDCEKEYRSSDRFKEYRKNRYAADPEKIWSAQIMSKYNINAEQYYLLLSNQNGGCKICHKTPSGTRLDIDHDHKCCPGIKSCGLCIRGLLCRRCNGILGKVKENLETLVAMKDYISPSCAE